MVVLRPNAPKPSPTNPLDDLEAPTEERAVNEALAQLEIAERRLMDAEVERASRALSEDRPFKALVRSIGTVENAANALAVAMTYLSEYPRGSIASEHVAQKIVGHIGATTAISRTYVNTEAALKEPRLKGMLDELGITQAHLVTGPGHGAAANFALLFLEGALEKIYPDRYPRNVEGLQNLIADFCRPGSPLPSHVFPGVPSVSEGGELGYSLGIAAGAGLANADAVILAQIGDKESETGPLQAAIENHNAIYDFRKGLVLPVLHSNGLGISGTAIHSARSDQELRLYLRGLGYAPFIVDAENNDFMKEADRLAGELETLLPRRGESAQIDQRIDALEQETRELRSQGADLTNATLQRFVRQGLWNLGKKKALALELEKAGMALTELESSLGGKAPGELESKRLSKAEARVVELTEKLRNTRTPFIVYREAKGGGHAPAFVDGKPTKGAPIAHQLILSAKDLTSKDPKTRQILERWLSDLTAGQGRDALVPGASPALDAAMETVLPEPGLRLGSAPLAVGKSAQAIRPASAEPLLRPLPPGGRGTESMGSNALVDDYLTSYLGQNRGRAFLLSADTAESNRLKKTVTTLGRRLNLAKGKNHPESSGPLGDAIDTLSEQYLMSLAQGINNSGKQAIISNYEAFFHITASMVRQYIKFRRQAVEANATARRLGNREEYRAAAPNLVLHLSSLAFAQDHNGFSHQNPGLVDDLAADPREQVEVFMPPEANTAVLQMERAVQGTGKVVAVVADKQPRPQFLSKEEAKEIVEVGAAAWPFASNIDPATEKPDVVIAASGGYHTDEVFAASRILGKLNDDLEKKGLGRLRFSVVNVPEPFRLRAPRDQDDPGLKRLAAMGGSNKKSTDTTVFDQGTFDRLFPKGAPVVYNFGGFQRTAEGLFSGRERTVSAHGYLNEGSTTTRFDMMVRNRCDRFHLVQDAAKLAQKAGKLSPEAREHIVDWCQKQLDLHGERMERGESVDPTEIVRGIWEGTSEVKG